MIYVIEASAFPSLQTLYQTPHLDTTQGWRQMLWVISWRIGTGAFCNEISRLVEGSLLTSPLSYTALSPLFMSAPSASCTSFRPISLRLNSHHSCFSALPFCVHCICCVCCVYAGCSAVLAATVRQINRSFLSFPRQLQPDCLRNRKWFHVYLISPGFSCLSSTIHTHQVVERR